MRIGPRSWTLASPVDWGLRLDPIVECLRDRVLASRAIGRRARAHVLGLTREQGAHDFAEQLAVCAGEPLFAGLHHASHVLD